MITTYTDTTGTYSGTSTYVAGNVLSSLSTKWSQISFVRSSIQDSWQTNVKVQNVLNAVWHVKTSTNKALSTNWKLQALVGKTYLVSWRVFEPPPPVQIFTPTFQNIVDTISKSHRKTARIVVYESINGRPIYDSGDLSIPGGMISGGINFANSSVRRRANMAFIDKTGILTPSTTDDIFTTYGHIVKVFRGVMINGVNTEFPLGAFGISDVSVDDSGPGVQIAIDCYDYGDLLSRRGLIQDYAVPKGTNFGNAIQTLLTQQLPGIQFNFESTAYTTPALFFQTNADPWEAAIMMAKAIGCDLYFDPSGVCTMKTVPDYSSSPVTFTYEEGAASTVLYVNKRYTNRDAYNYFIVTGEHSGNATTGGGGPVRGDAYDDNPSSKTYWKGNYGTVPAPPVSSKLVTTQAQAVQAARGLLQNSIGKAERLHFNAIVNPLHEVGDVIQFTRAKSKINARYVIDSGFIPLGHDQAMDLTTRVRQGAA